MGYSTWVHGWIQGAEALWHTWGPWRDSLGKGHHGANLAKVRWVPSTCWIDMCEGSRSIYSLRGFQWCLWIEHPMSLR